MPTKTADSGEELKRVVPVSGANRGIGRAIVQELSGSGYRLSLGARDPAALEATFGPETDRRQHARFGRIDGPVINAAVAELLVNCRREDML